MKTICLMCHGETFFKGMDLDALAPGWWISYKMLAVNQESAKPSHQLRGRAFLRPKQGFTQRKLLFGLINTCERTVKAKAF